MRILYQCGGSYVSGMEIVELAIIRGLAARGHVIHCIVSGWNDGDFVGRLREAGISHTEVYTGKLTVSLRPKHLRWTLDMLRHLYGARKTVRRLVASFAPDVVVGCNRDALFLLGNTLATVPVVYHVHEAPAASGAGRLANLAVARRKPTFVCVSNFVKQRLIDIELASNDIHVVHNGTPPRTLRDRSEGTTFHIGVVSQLIPSKGHEDLLDALAILNARGIRFRCLIFGEGPLDFVAHLKAKAVALDLTEHMEWRGFEADQEELYRSVSALVVPSRLAEAFCMVAAEAGAHGIPVVATRAGGLQEIVVHDETGFLVDKGNPTELACRLELLANDEGERMRLGENAYNRTSRLFTTKRMVEQHELVLQDVTAGASAA